MFNYILIGIIVVLVLVIAVVITVLVGERSWGRTEMSKYRRFAFNTHLFHNRLIHRKHSKWVDEIKMFLMMVHNEITGVNVDLYRAQKTVRDNTILELIDVFDDQHGHRYMKVDTTGPRQNIGIVIIEITDYMKFALDKGMKDETFKGNEANEELMKVTEKKAVLTSINGGKASGDE